MAGRGTSFLVALACAGTSLIAAELPTAPSTTRIAEIIDSFRHCRLVDPDILTEASRDSMAAWLRQAQVATVDEDELGSVDRLILRHLRRSKSADEFSAFEAFCRSGNFQLDAVHLRPADPFVQDKLAWVPLTGRDGDYAGSGFYLLFDQGRWRAPIEPGYGLATPTGVKPAYPELTRAIWQRAQSIDGHPNLDLPECPAPEANRTDPNRPDEDVWDRLYGWTFADEDNLRGYLQRRALEHYGSGRERPPTRSARALYVELLYRRAWFDNGPGLGSKRWAERIHEADRALRDAVALGADLTRLGPVLRDIAGMHLRGAGALMIDPGTAHELYRLAAQAGDDTATIEHARFTAFGLDGAASDCTHALEILQPLVALDDGDAVFESAQILLQCADHGKRAPQQAIDLLGARLAGPGHVDRQSYNTLLASARCALATAQARDEDKPVPDCALPAEPVEVSRWLAGLFDAKRQRMAGELEEEIAALSGPGSKPEWTDYDLVPLLADKSCELPN